MQGEGPTTDWLNKATPDELVERATAIFGKIGQLPDDYQQKFVQSVRNDSAASRLFERIGTATS